MISSFFSSNKANIKQTNATKVNKENVKVKAGPMGVRVKARSQGSIAKVKAGPGPMGAFQ